VCRSQDSGSFEPSAKEGPPQDHGLAGVDASGDIQVSVGKTAIFEICHCLVELGRSSREI